MLLATSCAKEEVNTTGETELITVQLNPETKTALGAEGTTTWEADDKVSVTVGGEVVGTLSLVEGSTFSGEITAGLSGDATLNYPAGVTAIPEPQAAVNGSFADGAALLEGTTTVEKLRAGEGVELQNKTALLQFTVAQAGDVTFEVGTAKYTVTGCKTGETYYACVAPAEGVNLVARIDGYLSRATSDAVTFTASTVADLKELPAPKESGWGVKGNFDSWGTGYKLYNDLDGNIVAKNVKLAAKNEFKVVVNNTYYRAINTTPTLNKWLGLYKIDGNTSLPADIYDIYVNKDSYMMCIVEAGSSMPEFSSTNSEYYVVMKHLWSDWDYKLYVYPDVSWGDTNKWPGIYCEGNFYFDNNEYKYWKVANEANGKTVGFVFTDDNNGGTQQSKDVTNVKLTSDHFYYFPSWDSSVGKANISEFSITEFR